MYILRGRRLADKAAFQSFPLNIRTIVQNHLTFFASSIVRMYLRMYVRKKMIKPLKMYVWTPHEKNKAKGLLIVYFHSIKQAKMQNAYAMHTRQKKKKSVLA